MERICSEDKSKVILDMLRDSTTQTYYERAYSYFDKREYGKAIEYFKKSLELYDSRKTIQHLAIAYAMKGDMVNAKKWTKEARRYCDNDFDFANEVRKICGEEKGKVILDIIESDMN